MTLNQTFNQTHPLSVHSLENHSSDAVTSLSLSHPFCLPSPFLSLNISLFSFLSFPLLRLAWPFHKPGLYCA